MSLGEVLQARRFPTTPVSPRDRGQDQDQHREMSRTALQTQCSRPAPLLDQDSTDPFTITGYQTGLFAGYALR